MRIEFNILLNKNAISHETETTVYTEGIQTDNDIPTMIL